MSEIFEIVDREGRVIGWASRSECHRNPSLIHQAVHVQVFDGAGRLFLQKRSASKDVQPGKWDSSVGGHLRPSESPEAGARRELKEELGIADCPLTLAYEYFWESPIETELVRTFVTEHDGPFLLQADEIEDGRFWTLEEIRSRLDEGIFTPQFVFEFSRLFDWIRTHPRSP